MNIDFLLVRPGPPLHSVYSDRAEPLALGLKARGYQPAILTTADAPYSSSLDIPVFHVDTKRRIRGGETWDPSVAHRYGVTNFRAMAFCEFGYVQEEVMPTPYPQLMAEVPADFAEVDHLFREHTIRRVFHPNIGGEVIRQVVSIVARKHAVPVLYEAGPCYFPGRVLMALDDRGSLPFRPKLRFADLPADRQRFLREYLEEKTTSRKVVNYAAGGGRRFWPLVAEFIRKGKYREANRVRKGLQTALRFAQFELIKAKAVPLDELGPFIYFPLAYATESPVVVGSPKCFRQDFIAEFVARVLPQGLSLGVKQHPFNPAESMPYEMIRRIVRLPEVRLVPPATSSWDLVKRASAVVSVHGTPGFEALLMRRPVVVLGVPPYRGWGVTHDVADLDDLPRVLEEALAAELSEERLLDFLASFESVHVRGDWICTPLNPDVMASSVIEMFDRLAARNA